MEIADWDRRRLIEVMAALVDEAWTVIEPNLVGLTDDEYFWEPEPGSWGVRPVGDIRTSESWGKGPWRVEVDFSDPSPPMTTIGWRCVHAYDCFSDYSGRALGDEPKDWNDIAVPGSATEAVALLSGAVETVRSRFDDQTDAVLGEIGSSGQDLPRWYLLDKGMIELIHHTAEIGLLRRMFRRQSPE